MNRKLLLFLGFLVVGLIVGILTYNASLSLHSYYSQFGVECIPPGEPFLTCGPWYHKMLYTWFKYPWNTDTIEPLGMLFYNLIVWIIVFGIIGTIFAYYRRSS